MRFPAEREAAATSGAGTAVPLNCIAFAPGGIRTTRARPGLSMCAATRDSLIAKAVRPLSPANILKAGFYTQTMWNCRHCCPRCSHGLRSMSAGSRLKRGQLTESAVTGLTEDRNTANLGFRRHRHKHGLKVFSPRLRPLPVPANCCVNLGLQTKRRVQKNFCGVPIALPCARPAEQQRL